MIFLSAICLLLGALLSLLGAIGVLRLPDVYMRMHAATKVGVAGAGLILVAAAAFDGSRSAWIKGGISILFLVLTTPVAGHLLGRAAYVSGAPFWRGTVRNDLEPVPLAEPVEQQDHQDSATETNE